MNNNGIHHEGKKSFKLANTVRSGKHFGLLIGDKVDLAGNGSINRPVCVINDCGSVGDDVIVHIFGSNASTMEVSAGGDINVGDLITSDQYSRAVNIADLGAGTYNICGVAVSNALPGDYLEFSPTLGLEKTITA